MYQALYRKWRPRDFDEVVGQEHITVTLKNEVASRRFSHAYLFTGSRGTGKTTCSKILAKAVNCLQSNDGNPCNACDFCKGIDDGSILDILEIDAASNNGVDNIRQLCEEAYFTPALVKYRVYILDECHMLSPGAVNALLKILEEPPAHVIFILATTEAHKVLPTISSRCQRFDFKRIRSRMIADRLLYVCEQEQLPLKDDAAMLIARLSDGGMRDALSLLDRCTASNGEITVQTVTQAAGLAGQDHLFALAQAILAKKASDALLALEKMSEYLLDYAVLCEQLIGHFRNVMILKTVKEPEDLIQATLEDLEKLRKQAQGISLEQIMHVLDILQDTLGRISRTTFKRTEFEMAVICLCESPSQAGLQEISARIDRLEQSIRSGHAALTASQNAPAEAKIKRAALSFAGEQPKRPSESSPTRPNIQPQSPAQDPVEPFLQWDRVLAELQKNNGALYGAMIQSCAFISGDRILIDCENEVFRNLLRTSMAAKESLRNAIMAVTSQKYNLGPYDPKKHAAAQETVADPLAGMLKKARELNVPVEMEPGTTD